MDRLELARKLAVTLTGGLWRTDFLAAQLKHNLPTPVHKHIPAICDELAKDYPCLYAPSVEAAARGLLETENFENVFQFCLQHDSWPAEELASPAMAPIKVFAGLDVPCLPSLQALAEWLDLPLERLDYLADLTGRFENHADPAVNHYHYRLQPKKTKGTRLIEAPKPTLKALQRKILDDILHVVPAHEDAFAFIRQRNCLDAAQRHASEEIVVCFDLKDFFARIGFARVFGLFRCLGYPQQVAMSLAGLCTVITPMRVLEALPVNDKGAYRSAHLPQGAPTSPALANLLAFSLDRRLAGLARRLGANYSRYADDLCFSGERGTAPGLLHMVPEITADEGFFLNARKTRIMSSTSRQTVTGVVVNRHVNIPRHKFDRLKAIIHACRDNKDQRILDPVFRAKLLGQIAWVETVNPLRGEKLRRYFEAMVERRFD